MARYNTHLIKVKASYSLKQIVGIFNVDVRTVSRWINQEDLKVIEKGVTPLLIMGNELKDFLDKKQKSKKVHLTENEYYCMKCGKSVNAVAGSEGIVDTGKTIGKNKVTQVKKIGFCSICGIKVNKFLPINKQTYVFP